MCQKSLTLFKHVLAQCGCFFTYHRVLRNAKDRMTGAPWLGTARLLASPDMTATIACGHRNESSFVGLERPRGLQYRLGGLEVAEDPFSTIENGDHVAMTRKNRIRSAVAVAGLMGCHWRGNCSDCLWTVQIVAGPCP